MLGDKGGVAVIQLRNGAVFMVIDDKDKWLQDTVNAPLSWQNEEGTIISVPWTSILHTTYTAKEKA